MAKPTMLRRLITHGLLPGDTEFRVRVPSRAPGPGEFGVWHLHPSCEAGVRTRTVTVTAQHILDQVSDLDNRATLCSCGTLNAAVYTPDLADPDRAAVAWLADLDDAVSNRTLHGKVRIHRHLNQPPDPTLPVLGAAVRAATQAATDRLAALPDDTRYRWALLSELVAAVTHVRDHLRHRSGGAGLARLREHPGASALLTSTVIDPDVYSWYTRWGSTPWEDRAPLVDDGLRLLSTPRVWVQVYAPAGDLYGVADTVAHTPAGRLLRVPLLAVARSTQHGIVLAVDDGYDADTVAAAYKVTAPGDVIDADVLAAMHAART